MSIYQEIKDDSGIEIPEIVHAINPVYKNRLSYRTHFIKLWFWLFLENKKNFSLTTPPFTRLVGQFRSKVVPWYFKELPMAERILSFNRIRHRVGFRNPRIEYALVDCAKQFFLRHINRVIYTSRSALKKSKELEFLQKKPWINTRAFFEVMAGMLRARKLQGISITHILKARVDWRKIDWSQLGK